MDSPSSTVSLSGSIPHVRTGHSAFSSSSNVIIWGGADGESAFADCFLLDLTEFKWRTLSTKGNVPPARYCFSCATTSFKGKDGAIMFGGSSPDALFNDIFFLDSASLTWETLSTEGQPPSARTMHSSTVIGSKLYIFGGSIQGDVPVDQGPMIIYVLDLENMKWSQISADGAPSGRFGMTCTAVNKNIYLIGGMSKDYKLFNEVLIFDTETESWIEAKATNPPPPMTGHATVLYQGKIVSVGGLTYTGPLEDIYVLDTNTLTWDKMQHKVTARLNHTATLVENRIVVLGGASMQQLHPLEKAEVITFS